MTMFALMMFILSTGLVYAWLSPEIVGGAAAAAGTALGLFAAILCNIAEKSFAASGGFDELVEEEKRYDSALKKSISDRGNKMPLSSRVLTVLFPLGFAAFTWGDFPSPLAMSPSMDNFYEKLSFSVMFFNLSFVLAFTARGSYVPNIMSPVARKAGKAVGCILSAIALSLLPGYYGEVADEYGAISLIATAYVASMPVTIAFLRYTR